MTITAVQEKKEKSIMTNTFIKELENMYNIKNTENSALAYKSTLSKVYDMFAFGGAYRNRSDEDVIKLFKEAYDENPELALKCLFYLGDIRGGQGERRFFDVCFKWLCQYNPVVAECLIPLIAEYRRWDEVVKTTYNTPCWNVAVNIIKNQLYFDIKDNNVSLCAKWMPSENASSKETKKLATQLRTDLGITAKQYRKMLSHLRAKIKLVESQMSQNRWNEIEFDKLPSKAGFKYRAAFARNPETAEKYRDFINSKKTKVNAGTLYPYEIVRKARAYSYFSNNNEVITLDKYWNNLKDYFNGADNSIMCVCDFSGSMTWGNTNILPIDVSLSLGLYTAERMNGPFKNCFISFSNHPQFHKVLGNTIVEKVNTALQTAEYANTNLPAVFDLFYNMIEDGRANSDDLPKTLVIISDMEIDNGSTFRSKSEARTTMDQIAVKWAKAGLRFPNIVYWNVNARNNTILQEPSSRITYVSGCSPAIFTQVLAGKNGIDLMLDTIDNNPRYEPIRNAYIRAITSSNEF